MMAPISSRQNPRFRTLKLLASSSRARRESGQTLLDGDHLLAMALEAGVSPDWVVFTEAAVNRETVASLLDQLPASVPRFLFSDDLMRSVGLVDSPSGLVSVVGVAQPACEPDTGVDCLLLDTVQDPGNVGTIMRTAAAAGIRQVLLSEGCAGAWSPRTLRAGMGAQYLMQVFEQADLGGYLARFSGKRAVTSLENGCSLYQEDLSGPVAWLFGNEGQGVSESLLALADTRMTIPMSPGSESLNVAAAVAVCLFEVVRQRQLG